jgi:hypothetical protein
LALGAIFVAAGNDLNARDFISRGVEGSSENHNKSIGCFNHWMETPRIEDSAARSNAAIPEL